MIDYFQLVNERDGGINGVKLTWEECETEYNNARGVECYERMKKGPTGNTVFHPLSTGITYGLIEKAPTDKIPMIDRSATAAPMPPTGASSPTSSR
jgi:branched-chain amino acid transport system substrate-binding protein